MDMSRRSSYVAWNGSEYSSFPYDYSSELSFQGDDQDSTNGTARRYDEPDQGSPSNYGYARDRFNDRDDLQEAFVRGNTSAEITSAANRASRVSQVSRDVDEAFAVNTTTNTDRGQRNQKRGKYRTDDGSSGNKRKKDKNVKDVITLDKDGPMEKNEKVYDTQNSMPNQKYYHGQDHKRPQ